MFRTIPLSIIRSFFTVHTAMTYVIEVCRQLASRIRTELSETCRVLFKNTYEKLVHLVGFIIRRSNELYFT